MPTTYKELSNRENFRLCSALSRYIYITLYWDKIEPTNLFLNPISYTNYKAVSSLKQQRPTFRYSFMFLEKVVSVDKQEPTKQLLVFGASVEIRFRVPKFVKSFICDHHSLQPPLCSKRLKLDLTIMVLGEKMLLMRLRDKGIPEDTHKWKGNGVKMTPAG